MAVYSVTYDLRKEGQDYSNLIKQLETFEHYKYQLSAWLIKSDLTSQKVYEQLKPFIDKNDHILVISVTNDGYGQLTTGSWNAIKKLFE